MVARDEAERVDTLQYSWHSLQEQVRDTGARLAELEPQFRRQLVDDVAAFTGDCQTFFADYQTVRCRPHRAAKPALQYSTTFFVFLLLLFFLFRDYVSVDFSST